MQDPGNGSTSGPSAAGGRQSSVSSQGSNRYETFTEAVPLALSSMAHASLQLDDGVLDGIKQVLSHTLLSCVNYARIVHPPHQWTFRDLVTSPFAWTPNSDGPPKNLPFALERLQFKHQYSRNAWIYLKPALPQYDSAYEEIEKDWPEHVGILGRVSLLYTSTEPLTAGELDGTDTDDMPPTILYKVVVESRSLPPTGNQQAVQAEELSMLSFGGSVDDDVKYGALASLYDTTAKYVLEIYSVRGKKYKFDLMDSTLCNGMVPRLPSSSEGDPFVKSLCATVTDHENTSTSDDYAITQMHLSLEGKPRAKLDSLPSFDFMTQSIMSAFLLFNPSPPLMATAMPSGHRVLLDSAYAGRIYVNGRYVTTWGKDPRIGSHGAALFGVDLLAIPFWHGRIVDYEAVKHACAQMWHEVLVDARLLELNIARRLLLRLMTGKDTVEDEDDQYDEDDGIDTSVDCLESQVLSSPYYDRVGIAPKALGTRFKMEFGVDAFPCRAHEVDYVRVALPHLKPVVVPHRLRAVLTRGGYFEVQRTVDELWFVESRPPKDGDEKDLVLVALQRLEEAGCGDLSADKIAFADIPVRGDDVVGKKSVVRYSEQSQMFSVNKNVLNLSVSEYAGESYAAEKRSDSVDWNKLRAHLLGLYIAQCHPDGRILAQFMLRCSIGQQ